MYFGSPLTGPFTVGGPSFTSHSVLKNKQKQGTFSSTTETRCSSSFTEATKHLVKGGRWNGSPLPPAHPTPPWEDTREPTALHTASLTKQYWYHWLRSALVIALPHRFECNDMDFGSVCDSRESCQGALFFKENKKSFFINSRFVASSFLCYLLCKLVL